MSAATAAVVVTAPHHDQQPRAQSLAAQLSAPLHHPDDALPAGLSAILIVTAERLALQPVARPGQRLAHNAPVYVDFVAGANAHRRRFGGGRRQAIARACGLRAGNSPTILDACAGLGGDGFALAALGCRVTLCERNPIIAALLADGLRRAAAHPDTQAIAARMQLIAMDAKDALGQHHADTAYLDPMFPARRNSAAVKKPMAALHHLIGPDSDADPLPQLALTAGCRRVVVKRPRHAPTLGDQTPDAQLHGQSTRFDLYFSTPPTGGDHGGRNVTGR